MRFGENLQAAMRQRDVSVRKLATTWRPANPESGRRNLHKYLAGQKPTERVAAEIAGALEVPVSDLIGTGDDDEDIHQMVRDLRNQIRALESAVNRAERVAS